LELTRILKPEVFFHFSTDEVYGPMLEGIPHPEWDEIIPSNPYSASKMGQEALAIAYWRSYGLPMVITNTMNIIGERQDVEKTVILRDYKIENVEQITIDGESYKIAS
jgi:dTDP-glucose 4,6-dehydratase